MRHKKRPQISPAKALTARPDMEHHNLTGYGKKP
jgi:hypothetical protein